MVATPAVIPPTVAAAVTMAPRKTCFFLDRSFLARLPLPVVTALTLAMLVKRYPLSSSSHQGPLPTHVDRAGARGAAAHYVERLSPPSLFPLASSVPAIVNRPVPPDRDYSPPFAHSRTTPGLSRLRR